MSESGDDDAYGGLFGAFPYAFRQSGSRLFRAYVLVGGALAGLLSVFFGFALVVQIANTLGGVGGTLTFARSFFLFIGFLIVTPLIGPVLLVARRHRRGRGEARYDRVMAVLGFVFAGSLYLAGIASMPECFVLDGQETCRPAPSGTFAPVVAVLYAVPPVASPLIPFVVAAVMALVDRTWERTLGAVGR